MEAQLIVGQRGEEELLLSFRACNAKREQGWVKKGKSLQRCTLVILYSVIVLLKC